MNENDWKKTLEEWIKTFEKYETEFWGKRYELEKGMTEHFNDGYEYEFHSTDYGTLIGRFDPKTGEREVLCHLD